VKLVVGWSKSVVTHEKSGVEVRSRAWVQLFVESVIGWSKSVVILWELVVSYESRARKPKVGHGGAVA